MKIRGIMMGAVIVGALILLSYGLAFAAAATEAEAELPLIDCQQTIHKILTYNYGYVPTSETSNVSVRVIKSWKEEVINNSYDPAGNITGQYTTTTERTGIKYNEAGQTIFPLIEKANRNEKTGSESLVNGYGFSINEIYDSENPGRLKEITISQNPPSGGERPFEETGILPGGCYPPEKVPSLPETTTLNDFTYYPDGNISGYSETIMDGPHGNLNRVSDIKYDDNGKIVGMVMAYTFGAIDNNGPPSIVTRNIKYNNFGDRVYWEEIRYNNYPPQPPVVKKETTLTCNVTQLDAVAIVGQPIVHRISGKLFTTEFNSADNIAHELLGNKMISIIIDGPVNSNGILRTTILTAKTDVTGYYWVDFGTKNIPGEYKVTAQFNGDNEYLASSAQASFLVGRVVKMPTALTCEVIIGVPNTEMVQLEYTDYEVTGRLVEFPPYMVDIYPSPPAKGIAGKVIKIEVTLAGNYSTLLPSDGPIITTNKYETKTDENGYYSFNSAFCNLLGGYIKQVTVEFAGDEKYGPSSATGQFFIKDPGTKDDIVVIKDLPSMIVWSEPQPQVSVPQTTNAGVFIVNDEKEGLTTETHKDWFWYKK